MDISRTSRLLLAPALVASALAVSACGGSGTADSVKHEATRLQQQGQAVQTAAEKAAADVKAGRKTQDQANRELEQQTKALERSAKRTAAKAIDAAKSQSGVPDQAKKALDDAQKQIQTAP